MTAPGTEAELWAIERAGWDALCVAGAGADFYAELMLAEAVMIIATGDVLDRETTVTSLRQAPPWSSYEITEDRTIFADEHNAVLVYTARAHRGSDEPFVAAMTSCYTRRDRGWRLVSYQQTPMIG